MYQTAHGYFFTKVVGVTFDDRQDIIAELSEGDRLYFERDPYNQYDNFAVKVMTTNGRQIGFIGRDHSEQISREILNGYKFNVTVSTITGGGFDSNYGVNIKVEY